MRKTSSPQTHQDKVKHVKADQGITESRFDFVSKYEIAQLIGLAPATLKHYRLSGCWSEGIHWVRLNARVIRYNKTLVQDWIQNKDNPHLHQRAIESYLRSLPSYKKKIR